MEHSIICHLTTEDEVHTNVFSGSEITARVQELMALPSTVEILVSTVVGPVCYESKFSKDPVLKAMFPIMYPGGWNRDFYTYPASQF
jgi:hypothetical protein